MLMLMLINIPCHMLLSRSDTWMSYQEMYFMIAIYNTWKTWRSLYFMNTLKLGGLTDNLDELQFS